MTCGFFGAALSAGEVVALFSQPVLYLNFNEASGWADHSMFGNAVNCSGSRCPSSTGGVQGKGREPRRHAVHRHRLQCQPGPQQRLVHPGGLGRAGGPQEANCIEHYWDYFYYCTRYEPQGILGFNSGRAGAYPSLQHVMTRPRSSDAILPVEHRIRFGFADASGWIGYWESGPVLAENAWNHVVVTFTSGSMKLYVNGSEAGHDDVTFAGDDAGRDESARDRSQQPHRHAPARRTCT